MVNIINRQIYANSSLSILNSPEFGLNLAQICAQSHWQNANIWA